LPSTSAPKAGHPGACLGFADAVREELDFRVEAANMAAVTATADGAVRIPVPHRPLCGERVLADGRLGLLDSARWTAATRWGPATPCWR